MGQLQPLEFEFRCGRHDTNLVLAAHAVLGPMLIPTDQSQAVWRFDLSEMACPLDPYGGEKCKRYWGPKEHNFTILPHGLLTPGEELENVRPLQLAEVRPVVGEAEGGSGRGTLAEAEGRNGQSRGSERLPAVDTGEPVEGSDPEAAPRVDPDHREMGAAVLDLRRGADGSVDDSGSE